MTAPLSFARQLHCWGRAPAATIARNAEAGSGGRLHEKSKMSGRRGFRAMENQGAWRVSLRHLDPGPRNHGLRRRALWIHTSKAEGLNSAATGGGLEIFLSC